jgi:hypothetical protein
MNKLLLTIAIPAVVVLASCSSIRQIRPLEPGQSAVNVSLGGPIIQALAVDMPVPLLTVGYNRGLQKDLDLEGGLDLTSGAFGILHVDLGANWRPLRPQGWVPGVILTPKAQLFDKFKPQNFLLYPEAIITAWWNPTKRLYPYAGIENLFELHSFRPDENEQPHHWLIAPYIGVSVCNKAWQYQFEARYYTPNIETITTGPTRYIGIGGYGGVGAFVGVGYMFGEK